jgi:hypothetical protein
VGTEVKVQSLSSANRLGGRIRRRVSTAARQALCAVLCQFVRSILPLAGWSLWGGGREDFDCVRTV